MHEDFTPAPRHVHSLAAMKLAHATPREFFIPQGRLRCATQHANVAKVEDALSILYPR
jgi:hypothetical protein